jgi:hypothetical protein
MLTEEEWAQIEPLLRKDIREIQRYRGKHRASLEEALKAVPSLAVRSKLLEITGYSPPKPSEIWHHRLKDHGQPCRTCGHLLRTPRARRCANCGAGAV